MSETCAARLERLAHEVRTFLEPHWAAWHVHTGSPDGRRTMSEGTCGRSSTFLRDVLRDEGFRAETAFGSPVECDCGFLTKQGWKGHGWVLVQEPACIIDLTADQFGEDPVVIAAPDDPRYRPGQDVAGEGWIAERQRVARELMRDWQAKRGSGGA